MIHETIDEALSDPALLGAALGPLESWATWRTILRAAFGLGLTEDELDLLEQLAGPNRSPPSERVKELWTIAGRRSGKSRVAALIASYVATLDHSDKLAPGETGYIISMSPTRAQSKAIHGYIRAFFARSPVLSQMVISHNDEEIELVGNIKIAVTTNDFRTVRSRTILLALLDEVAFWRDDTSANPDTEIYRALKPSLIASGGMLVGISSPYRPIGLLHQKWKEAWNKDGPVLIVRAPTETLNPTISSEDIAAERAADPEAAASEWDAEWRAGLSSLLDDASIDRAIDPTRPLQLPPQKGINYHAFVDASGGRHDSFTMTIGFNEDGRFTAAVIVGKEARPTFDPTAVAAEFAALAKEYGCTYVTGDNYSAEWVTKAFEAAGMGYRRAPVAKSQLYIECVPFFMRGAVSIPDHPTLIRELRQLERRTHRSGRDSVDHPSHGGTDDYANSVVGALFVSKNEAEVPTMVVGHWGGGGGGAVVFGGAEEQPEPYNELTSFQDYTADGEVNPDRLLDRNPARLAYLKMLEELP